MSEERIEAINAELARKSAYGIHPDAKTAALAPMSQAWQGAAFNLTHKAFERLLRGDDAAADRLVAKAATLEFDEHEQEWPQLLAADQTLFNVLADHVELWRDHERYPDELAAARFDGVAEDWEEPEEPPISLSKGIVDAASGADSGAIASLRGSVEELLFEANRWEINSVQVMALNKVVAGLSEGTRARDLPRETTEKDRAAIIRAHLDLATRLVEAFNP